MAIRIQKFGLYLTRGKYKVISNLKKGCVKKRNKRKMDYHSSLTLTNVEE